MNRRSFLQSAIALLVAEAAPKLIPFGRVWSFPKEIVLSTRRIHNPFLHPGDVVEIFDAAYSGRHGKAIVIATFEGDAFLDVAIPRPKAGDVILQRRGAEYNFLHGTSGASTPGTARISLFN